MKSKITGYTKLTGLLGSPVAHSKSPMMQNEAFHLLGLDFAYLAFDVKEDGLERAVEGLKVLGARGWNVTMPDKNKMCDLADQLSVASQISHSVNTIVNENGTLIGYTTDGVGFMRAVQEEGQDIIGKKMVVIGAGGAAAAIVVQAALDGVAEISIFNRKGSSFERMEGIIRELEKVTDCKLAIYDFYDKEQLRKKIAESVILVNATSVGMAPNVDVSVITDPTMFHSGLFVYDAIYNPQETMLMRQAKEAGCKTAGGLSMLLYQGAESFKLWTGEEMPVEIIKEKYFS